VRELDVHKELCTEIFLSISDTLGEAFINKHSTKGTQT
jgi:hypothetical protein